jgi:hypothetical protein
VQHVKPKLYKYLLQAPNYSPLVLDNEEGDGWPKDPSIG